MGTVQNLVLANRKRQEERIIIGKDTVVHILVYISFYSISRTSYCLKLIYIGLLTRYFNWLLYT